MGDAVLCALAAATCMVAAIERPDRYLIWCVCAYFCEAVMFAMILTGGPR